MQSQHHDSRHQDGFSLLHSTDGNSIRRHTELWKSRLPLAIVPVLKRSCGLIVWEGTRSTEQSSCWEVRIWHGFHLLRMGANNCASQGPQACAQSGSQQSPRTPKVCCLWIVMFVMLQLLDALACDGSCDWSWPHNPGQAEEDDVSRLTMWEHDVEAMKEDSCEPPWWQSWVEGSKPWVVFNWVVAAKALCESRKQRRDKSEENKKLLPGKPRSQFFFVALWPHWSGSRLMKKTYHFCGIQFNAV